MYVPLRSLLRCSFEEYERYRAACENKCRVLHKRVDEGIIRADYIFRHNHLGYQVWSLISHPLPSYYINIVVKIETGRGIPTAVTKIEFVLHVAVDRRIVASSSTHCTTARHCGAYMLKARLFSTKAFPRRRRIFKDLPTMCTG